MTAHHGAAHGPTPRTPEPSMTRSRRLSAVTRPFAPGALALLLLLGLAAGPLHAQDDDRAWSLKTEAGASLFFGASSQSAVLFRSDYSYGAGRWEGSLKAGFDYGETEDASGTTFVSSRSWTTEAEVDYQAGRWQPFVFVNADGSLQRAIDLRVSSGAGVGYDLIEETETASLDASLAALVERTDPRVSPGEPDDVTTLGRWSARLRGSKKLAEERIGLEFTSFFKPSFDAFSDDYLFTFEGKAAFQLTRDVSLGVSFIDVYDSLAESRGARSNNDGRVFFSIITTID